EVARDAPQTELRIIVAEPIYPAYGNDSSINETLQFLRASGSYINVILATDVLVSRALREIYEEGMFGHPYVWIVINNVHDDVRRLFTQPGEASTSGWDGLIMFDPHVLVRGEKLLAFEQRWQRLDPKEYVGAGPGEQVTDMVARSYSCAWMIALSYQKDIERALASGRSDQEVIKELREGIYSRSIGNFSSDLFQTISYDGPAGFIQLNKYGNAVNIPAQFLQIQYNDLMVVATTETTADGQNRPVNLVGSHVWPGWPSGTTPNDAPMWVYENITWEDGISRLLGALTTVGVLISLVLIVLVIWQRKHLVIRAANPTFCVLELIGIIIMYLIVTFRIGLYNNYTCVAVPLAFTLGMGLLLGSLAVKNLREYRIYNNVFHSQMTNSNATMLKQLAVILIIFLLPGVLTFSLIRPRVRYIAIGDDAEAFACVKTNENISMAVQMFLLVLWIIPPPLLTVATAYFTLHAREVTAKWNETRLVRYTMYNFMLFFMIFIPTTFLNTIHFRVALIVQDVVTLFTLKATLLILFGPKVVHMWILRHDRIQEQRENALSSLDNNMFTSSDSSDNNNRRNSSSNSISDINNGQMQLNSRDDDRRMEMTMRKFGFLSAGKGSEGGSRRRKNVEALRRQSSADHQTLYFPEPAEKGPVSFPFATGSLHGPDLRHRTTQAGQSERRSGESQAGAGGGGGGGGVSLWSEETAPVQQFLGESQMDDEGEDNNAIPVLFETDSWFKRLTQQWRPMQVVVVASLSMVILSDNVNPTVETCLYNSVEPVSQDGHFYIRIHCAGLRKVLLEFAGREARDDWLQTFKTPLGNSLDGSVTASASASASAADAADAAGTAGAGTATTSTNEGPSTHSLSRARLESMYREMYQDQIAQYSTIRPNGSDDGSIDRTNVSPVINSQGQGQGQGL
ncbi:Gamma-aminobutyric acid type B receptor subunit 1, partial [Podila epigama]